MPNNGRMETNELIEALGGTNATAVLAGVRPPSVSEWRKSQRIPDDKLIRLAPILHARRIATRWELFPSDWWLIWPELIGADGAPEVPQPEAKAA